jgi:hypothetical protein
MNKLSGHDQPRFQPLIPMVVLAAGFLVIAGCSKKTVSTAPATPTNSDSVLTTAPTPENRPPPVYNTPPATPPTVATASTGGADLKQLNHIYIGWIIQNRRRVKTFEEFVAASGVQVPPAPDGKKYVIDNNGYINLANR